MSKLAHDSSHWYTEVNMCVYSRSEWLRWMQVDNPEFIPVDWQRLNTRLSLSTDGLREWGTLVHNVVTAYERSSINDKIDGGKWYSVARQRPVATVSTPMWCGLLAASSPNKSWGHNYTVATRWAQSLTYSGGVTGVQRAKMQLIRRGSDPLDVLRGLKERAFYRALMGGAFYTRNDVCIDRHSLAVCLGQVLPPSVAKGVFRNATLYAKLQAVYHLAKAALRHSSTCEWSASGVQACTWLYWRREHAVSDFSGGDIATGTVSSAGGAR